MKALVEALMKALMEARLLEGQAAAALMRSPASWVPMTAGAVHPEAGKAAGGKAAAEAVAGVLAEAEAAGASASEAASEEVERHVLSRRRQEGWRLLERRPPPHDV